MSESGKNITMHLIRRKHFFHYSEADTSELLENNLKLKCPFHNYQNILKTCLLIVVSV